MGREQAAVELHGREPERAVVEELLAGAGASRSGVLVLRGEAGSGKTAVLDDARGRAAAAGMSVLRATGHEAEAQLPFAALHQLLAPVLPAVDRIADVQRAALRSALALEPGDVGDAANRFVLSLAVLSLLAEVAAEGAVLCLVDDAHWLDQPSADALAFVARRVDAEGIVLLFATRDGDGEGPSFRSDGLPERRLGPLAPAAAADLVDESAGAAVAPEVRRAIVEAAGGNPLALIEIPAALTPDQLAGRTPPPRPMPLGEGLQQMLLAGVGRLPAAARTLLLVAAAEGAGDAAVVLAAAGDLGVSAAALAEAEAAGIVRSDGSALVFRHPLLRTAIYRSASLPDREAAHRALAGALPGEVNADRRAWHRAALVLYPDEAIAGELERTAERARRRMGHAAASAALRRSAELTAEDGPQARRLAAAARSAWDAGRPDEAIAAVRAAGPAGDTATYAELAHVRGLTELGVGAPAVGAAVLIDGATHAAEADPVKALTMLFDAGQCASYAGDLSIIGETARRATALPIRTSEPEARHVELMASLAATAAGRNEATIGRVVAALDQLDRLPDGGAPRWLVWAGAAASGLGDQERDQRLRRRAEALARASASLGDLANVLESTAFADVVAGRIASAAVHADEGLRLSVETGLTNSACLHRAILAWVAAVRGDEPSAEALARRALDDAAARGLGLQHAIADWAVGLLHLGLGRWDTATARLASATAGSAGTGHPIVALRAAPDLVEAAVHGDRPDVARRATELLVAYTRDGGADWALALTARCQALVAPTADEREAGLRAALTFHDRESPGLGRARTQLLLGEHLRRERRRKEAREPLQAALDTFEQFGAAPWAERAHRELRASGRTARRRGEGTSLADLTALTPQERQIAGLVAEGATNKDVAARLFLSPRTVDHHLRNVFTKLGITARAELARLLVDEETTIGPG